MGLDVRLPIGMMFSVLGPILLAWGTAEGIVLDQQVGAAMLAFGLMMGTGAFFGRRRRPEA